MAELPKPILTKQTLTRALANANNINGTEAEITAAINQIYQALYTHNYGDDLESVLIALRAGLITRDTYIIFLKEVQLVSKVISR